MQPAFAGSAGEAYARIRAYMAEHGCESDKYSIVDHRIIAEPDVQFRLDSHIKWVGRLSPDERHAFFCDRRERLLNDRGRLDKRTETYFQNHASLEPVT